MRANRARMSAGNASTYATKAHVNGMESFWSMLKRGYYGTYHRMSPKHLHRYVREFAGRHNIRDLDTVEQMTTLAYALVGKRLRYRDLIGGAELEGAASLTRSYTNPYSGRPLEQMTLFLRRTRR